MFLYHFTNIPCASHPPLMISLVYQWYSLLFICSRILLTMYLAGSINELARRPARTLSNVPTGGWSTEVQRFSDQLIGDVVALSGHRFFYMTRRLMLAVSCSRIQ